MVAKRRIRDANAAFADAISEAGGEMLAPIGIWEVMRFRTKYGVGIVHINAKGACTWNAEALRAKRHLDAQEGSLSPVPLVGRKRNSAIVGRLLERDGSTCFFCRTELGADITVEHLVAIAHGGPNHISNLFLAHAACNAQAGHLSAPEKIAIRDGLRRPRPKAEAARHGGRGTQDTWIGGHRAAAAEALGIDWMTLAEMSEAIPPAYTEWLGRQIVPLQQREAA